MSIFGQNNPVPVPSAPSGPLSSVLAIITGHTGTSPGPASGIAYDLYVNSPDNPRVVTGIKPTGYRQPDFARVVALANGTPVPVYYSGEFMVFCFPNESLYVEECESA